MISGGSKTKNPKNKLQKKPLTCNKINTEPKNHTPDNEHVYEEKQKQKDSDRHREKSFCL